MKAKTVYQYDLDGNYVEEFPSVNKAGKALGINIPNICRVATGSFDTKGTVRHEAGGYQWSYTKVKKMNKVLTQSERKVLNNKKKEIEAELKAKKKAELKAIQEHARKTKPRKDRTVIETTSYHQYSMDGIYIQGFESSDELMEYIGSGYNKKAINQACAQIISSVYGSQWRYYKQNQIEKVKDGILN